MWSKSKVFLIVALLFCAMHGVMTLFPPYQPIDSHKFGYPIVLEGTVVGLPTQQNQRIRFELISDRYGRVELSAPETAAKLLIPSHRLSFEAVLREPQGLSNPNAVDYAQWLSQRGVVATGFVVRDQPIELIGRDYRYFFDYLRYAIQSHVINQAGISQSSAITLALLIGDRTYLDNDSRETLQHTGTSHLIAISGLHIGLMALIGFLIMRYLWSFSPSLCRRIPAQKSAIIFAIILALVYSLLAGFTIPTQRAFLMVLVAGICLLSSRNYRGGQILLWAGCVVILWNPFSLVSIGFWLSFTAVAILMFSGVVLQLYPKKWQRWLLPQVILSIMLVPMTIYWFYGFSWLSIVANLVAIPLVSFVVVPLVLISLLASFMGGWVWWLGLKIIALMMWFLGVLAEQSAFIDWHQLSVVAVAAMMVGCGLLLLPLRWYVRVLGLALLLLFWQKPMWDDKLQLRTIFFDVPKGYAVLLEQKNHRLLYVSENILQNNFQQFNQIVLPYMRANAIQQLDQMVVNYDANEPIALDDFMQRYRVSTLYTNLEDQGVQCRSGLQWTENDVGYYFMVSQDRLHRLSNRSCVLKVTASDHSLLLAGSIANPAKQNVMNYHLGQLPSTDLMLPSGWQNSAVGERWLSAIHPQQVINASRVNYQGDIPSLNTQTDGAVILNYSRD